MTYDSLFLSKNRAFRQLFSYLFIGLLTNFLGYALYLLLTHYWESPKLTMTGLYLVGAVISFFANRRFTFRHDGRIDVAGIRYIFVQLLGYLSNLTLLVFFVDWLGFAHQIVQAVAIVVVGILLFTLSRLFVFAPRPPEQGVIRP